MTLNIFKAALALCMVLPTLGWAGFPQLQSKEEMLPVLHAAATDNDKVLIGQTIYGFEWADPKKAEEAFAPLMASFGDEIGNMKSISLEGFEVKLSLMTAALTSDLKNVNVTKAVTFMQQFKPNYDEATLKSEFELNTKKLQAHLKEQSKDIQKTAKSITKIISLTDFDYIKAVGEGKVIQRYRVTYYDYEDKKNASLDFFLVAPKTKAPKAAKKETQSSSSSSSATATASTSSSTAQTDEKPAAKKVKEAKAAKKDTKKDTK